MLGAGLVTQTELFRETEKEFAELLKQLRALHNRHEAPCNSMIGSLWASKSNAGMT